MGLPRQSKTYRRKRKRRKAVGSKLGERKIQAKGNWEHLNKNPWEEEGTVCINEKSQSELRKKELKV